MLPFYLITLGNYLYYSKSKYFPDFLFRPRFHGLGWVGLVFITAGSGLYVQSDGMAGGLLLALAASSLAMGLVELFGVLGRLYFYGLVAVLHILLILDLLFHAS